MPAVTVRIKSRADLLGAPLLEFSDDRIEDLQLNPSLYDLGENFIQLDRDFLFAPPVQALRTGNLAEVIVHAVSENPLHSFFLEEVEVVLVGTPEDQVGGRGSRWGGPGLLYYLSRARFLPWYGTIVNGVSTWSDVTPGAVMIDMLTADQNTGADGVNALADLTWDFSATLDSDGNAWDTIDGDFDVAVGTDYLTAFGNLQLFDDLDLVMTPDFVLHAYKSFGSTLGGADWATGEVRFQRAGVGIGGVPPGGNILTDQGAMKRRNKGKRRASHILVQGRSDFAGDFGNYVLVERQGHNPSVDDVRVLYHEYPSNRTAVLNRVGRKILREGEVNNQNISEMEVMPGDDETGTSNEIGVGLYLPGPDGTNGHYWLGDRPTTHTGISFHDYNNDSPRIVALRIKLAEATASASEEEKQRSLHTWVQLGVPGNRSVLALTDTTVPGPSRHTHPLELCQAGAFPDAGSPLLLGAACSQDGINYPTGHAPWGSVNEERVQITAAQPVPLGWTVVVKTSHNKNISPSAANVVYDQRGNAYTKDAEYINTGSSGDTTIQIWRCVLTAALQQDDYIRFAIDVGSSEVPGLERGGKCVGAYAYPSTLGTPNVGTGAGAFSANPSIMTPGGDVEVAGIAWWGVFNVTEDAGWQPMIPRVNTGGGSGSTTSGLFGQQRFESSSGTWAPTFSAVTDWAAISVGYTSTNPVTSLATPRDGRPELIGTSPRAARCDHKHHVIRTTTPTAFDDWQVRRYPVTTLWTQVDDLDDPTTIISTWLLVQSDAEGEAVWLQLSGGDGGVTDHGALTGLLDDDHTQYVLKTLGGKEVVNTVAASGSSETLDLADGNWHDVTLTANCTFTFAGATNGVGCSFVLLLRQDGTGSRTVTWPGSVAWPSGTAPVLSTDANAVDVVSFLSRDGGTTWFGMYAGAPGTGTHDHDADYAAIGHTHSGGGLGTAFTVDAGTPTYDDTSDPDVVEVSVSAKWGIDTSGDPYFNGAGVTSGEEAALMRDPDSGAYFLRPYNF